MGWNHPEMVSGGLFSFTISFGSVPTTEIADLEIIHCHVWATGCCRESKHYVLQVVRNVQRIVGPSQTQLQKN